MLRVVVTAVIVVGVIALTWSLRGEGREALPAPEIESTVVSESEDPAKKDGGATEEEEVGGIVARPFVAESEETITPSSAVKGAWVKVVRKSDGQPLPGARVKAVNYGAVYQAHRSAKRLPSVEEITTWHLADEAGRVRLPEGEPGFSLVGTYRDLHGTAQLRDPGPFTLELVPDRTLRVSVIDSAGKSVAGVPVSLCAPRRDRVSALDTVMSDESGQAVFEHAQVRIGRRSDCFVRFGFPLLEAEELAVDLAASDRSPLRLTLPPLGSLRCRAVDGEGKPVPDDEVTTNLLAFEAGRSEDHAVFMPPIPRGDPAQAHCETVLPFVGLGLHFRWRVAPRRDESGVRPAEQDIVGPEDPGEEVSVDVVYGERRFPRLIGRLVRRDGTPIGAGKIGVIERHDPDRRPNWIWIQVMVEADGRFSIPLRYPDVPPGTKHTCELQELDGNGRQIHQPISVILPVNAYGEPRDHDLGDVIFDRGPLLLSGRLVDQDGKPVSGGEVELRHSVDGRRYGGFRDWTSSRTDDGHFKVHGAQGELLEGGHFKVGFRHPFAKRGSSRRWPEFPVGSQGIEVVVTMGGTLRGTIAKAKAPDSLEVHFYRGQKKEGVIAVRKDGSFRSRSLRPGLVSVRVVPRGGRSSSADQVLARIDDVAVEMERERADPRLQGIAIDQRAKEIVLRLQDEEGQPVAGVMVRSRPPAKNRVLGHSDREGKVSLTARRPLDLLLVKKGHRVRELNQVFDDAVILMNPCFRVCVRLVGLPADERNRKRISFWTRSEDRIFWAVTHSPARIASPVGTVDLDLPVEGPYVLRWLLDGRAVRGVEPMKVHFVEGKLSEAVDVMVPTGLLEML